MVETSPPGLRRASDTGWLALVAAAALLAHVRAMANGLVGLDDPSTAGAPHVLAGLSREGVRWAFAPSGGEFYWHPLTWLSLMLDTTLFGPGPAGHHAVNVALHALAAVLLFLVLREATGRAGPSAAAALLFAVHPTTVEAVTWVTERKTVLAGALAFAAVLAHVRTVRRPSPLGRAGVALLFAGSLLAKPIAAPLPAILLVLDAWPLGRLGPGPDRRLRVAGAILEKVPLAVMAIAHAAFVVSTAHVAPLASSRPLAVRAAAAAAAIPSYLSAFAWPVSLGVFNPYPEAVPGWRVAAGLATVAALVGGALALRRRAPAVAAGVAVFLLALAPVLGLVQAGLWPLWADRFLYLPLVGLSVAVAFGLPALVPEGARRFLAPTAAAAVAVLAALTVRQISFWHDSETLYRHGLEVAPGEPALSYLYGTELVKAGRYAEAEPHLAAAAREVPWLAMHRTQLGTVRLVLGRPVEAMAEYRAALALEPDNPEALFGLGQLLLARGDAATGRSLLARFVRTAPAAYAPERAQAAALLRADAARRAP
jgi:hypothetical protein